MKFLLLYLFRFMKMPIYFSLSFRKRLIIPRVKHSSFSRINMPEVSVVMPVYNSASTIAEAIDSVLEQSFTDWDLIICDDASTDDTVLIVSRYVSDTRVRHHWSR